MDAILNIFKSLGVDSSFFLQFAAVVVLFFILKVVLFSKLQEVLELRESKTTKLEGNANKKFAEAEELALKYKNEMDKAQDEAYGELSSVKNAELGKSKTEIKEVEGKLNSQIDEKRKVFTAELEEHKKNILKEADLLSENLVNKLTN